MNVHYFYSDYPRSWDLPQEGYKLVSLYPDDEEYDRITERFHQTIPHAQLLWIHRIQNKLLWRKYHDCSKRMLEFNGALQEHLLFHGTSATDPEKIYAGDASFDMRFSRNGLWGRGNYFAVNASYSNSYAYQIKGLKKILAAWVLTGASYTSPPKAFDKPPIRPRPGSEGIERRYDSINGIAGGSKVYITFENDHAYPAYLITYKDT